MVAQKAGVTISTVSSVINNSKYVSDALKKRVEQAIIDLNYSPVKENNNNNCKKTIGVVLPKITSVFFPPVLNGIEDCAFEHGYALIFCDSNYDFNKEENNIKNLKKYNIDGLILDSFCSKENEQEYFASLSDHFVYKKDIPIISLERNMASKDFYSVCVDNFSASYNATKHLIELGHKNIAHIAGNPVFPHSQERFNGYKAALLENGLMYDKKNVKIGDFSSTSGYSATKLLLETKGKFTAIFAANDQMAIGAIKTIKQAGLSIPNDIAVVGFDNIVVSTLIDPTLTTVNVPTYRMGYLAMEIITKLKQGIKCPTTNYLETNLIVRRSSNNFGNEEWELVGW